MSWIASIIAGLIPRTTFAKSVVLLSSATALGQGIVILAAPILTRMYAPEDFGVLGVYASILGIVSVIASLRYEQAIPLPGDDQVAINIVVVALIVVGTMSLTIGTTAYFLGDVIVKWINIPELQPYMYMVSIGICLVGTFQVFNYWAVRKGAFLRIAQTKLVQSGGSVTTQLAFGSFGFGAIGLIIGQVVGQAAGTISLVRVIRGDPARPLRAVSVRSLRGVARRYRRFPLMFTWSALLNSLGLMGPTLLLASFYGAAVVGWYALVQRILGMPASLLGHSVTNVYFSESARLAREAPAELQPLFWAVLKKLTLLGCLIIVPFGLVSPWLFPFVFGAEWANSGRYALIMSPMVLLQFLSSPFGVTLAVLERQDLALLRESVRLVLVSMALILAQNRGYSPEQALILLSIAGVISYMFHLYISWVAIRQHAVDNGAS